ncbi:MAG: carbonic anhydrase [Thermodesulfobacteriota bacterium]|nr:carbonic anhydrase [Thermodesulfobacteriota bacterium]
MQKKIALIFLLSVFFSASIHQDIIWAEMRHINKLRAGRPPFEIMEDMTDANLKFTAMTASRQGRLSKTQPPYITWLADPDARIQPELIMSDPQNKVYTVRVLGNQLELAKGSVDYGVLRLRSTILLITGNTGNQALRFYLEGLAQLEPADILKDLNRLPIKPQKVEKRKKQKPKKQKKEKQESLKKKWLDSVENNIDYQIEQALERYKARVKSGRLIITGGIIDLTNAYGRGHDRLIIININGEKNDEKLRGLPIMMRLKPKILTKCVGRKRNPEPIAPSTPEEITN